MFLQYLHKKWSKHKPFDNMMDPGIIFATQQRNDIATSANIDVDMGQYKELHLKPCVDWKVCTCGEAYVEEVYVRTCTIYSRMGPIKCKYYNYRCMSQRCTVQAFAVKGQCDTSQTAFIVQSSWAQTRLSSGSLGGWVLFQIDFLKEVDPWCRYTENAGMWWDTYWCLSEEHKCA